MEAYESYYKSQTAKCAYCNNTFALPSKDHIKCNWFGQKIICTDKIKCAERQDSKKSK